MKLPWLERSGGSSRLGSRSAPDGPEHIEAVVGDRGLDEGFLVAPVRQQRVEPDRIDHRAREDMGADLGALFHHDDRGVGRELLDADRSRKAGGAGADNDDVELHRLARRQFRCVHDLLQFARNCFTLCATRLDYGP